MSKSYFLSSLAFEVLVCSQCEKEIFLPGEGDIEKANDSDIIIGMHKMVESGALTATEDSGFDISPEFAPIVRSIINAKLIVKAMSSVRAYPVYYYISNDGAAFIESAENRKKTYRVGSVSNPELAELIHGNMELPSEDEFLQENIETFQEIIMSRGYDDSSEKSVLGITVSTPVEEAMQNEDVLCIIDIFSAESGEPYSRWIIYRLSVLEKTAVISPEKTEETAIYSHASFIDRISSLLEGITDDNS